MQRFFDIVFSGMALVLLSPLLLPLMFILRVTGEGEIFFPQSRVGRGGKYFVGVLGGAFLGGTSTTSPLSAAACCA